MAQRNSIVHLNVERIPLFFEEIPGSSNGQNCTVRGSVVDSTLIVIKPDGVSRGLVGNIVSRFELKGFRVRALRITNLTEDEARELYSPHKSKPFFNELVDFITSGPVVAAIMDAEGAVDVARRMVGSTRSAEAQAGTIRGDLGLGVTDNVIHASDSKENFMRESAIIFSTN